MLSSVSPSIGSQAIRRLCDEGQLDRALDILKGMDQQGTTPHADVYRSLLKVCARRNALGHAQFVHAHLTKNRLELTGYLGESVVITLVKCGALEDAVKLFRTVKQRSVFAWTAIISGLTLAGKGQDALMWYRYMQQEGVQPNTYTFVGLLKACGSMANLEQGRFIHAEAIRHGCDSDLYVRTALVDMYGRCGSVVDAQNVYAGLSRKDVVASTAMLGAYVQQGHAVKALELYEEMRKEGMKSDVPVLVGALQACGMLAEEAEDVAVDGLPYKLRLLHKQKAVHAEAWRQGYDSDAFVGSTLITVYGKCGSIVDAQKAFDGISQRNVVAWTALLMLYAQHGEAKKTLQLYEEMQKDGVNPDTCTFVALLLACGLLADEEEDTPVDGEYLKATSLEIGKVLHAAAKMKGYDCDVFVGNSLVSMYSKCGSILEAQHVFDHLSQRDIVSWNAILGAYSQLGRAEKAFELYDQMLQEGVSPNDITLVSILRMCSSEGGGLDTCRRIYLKHVSKKKPVNPLLASTIIHSFGKCASMKDAQAVFDALPQPDVISWTALIAGYAQEGDFAACLQSYERGRLLGMRPNDVTYVSVLSACSHAGLVDEGMEYFESMSRDHGITPNIDHYVCMVDMLGRAGNFVKIEHLLCEMPVLPNLALWLSLLSACRNHGGQVVLARRAFDCSVEAWPKHPAAYSLMCNIYADAGLWDCAAEVNELRHKACAWKKPGHTWIEHDQENHTFVVGECAIPLSGQTLTKFSGDFEIRDAI